MYNLAIFGKNLQRYRQFRGLTQSDLAAKVGLNKDTISKIELAKHRNMGFKYVILICKELDVKIEKLFTKDPKVKY